MWSQLQVAAYGAGGPLGEAAGKREGRPQDRTGQGSIQKATEKLPPHRRQCCMGGDTLNVLSELPAWGHPELTRLGQS